MGMLSKRYKPFEDFSGYVKNSKEIVLFAHQGPYNCDHAYDKINIAYSDTKDVVIQGYTQSSQYKSTLLVSLFEPAFFALAGKEFREIREARNKFNRQVEVKTEVDPVEVVAFINRWNDERGKERYGWQLHSGYDINFFERYYLAERQNLWAQFYYIEGKLQGYSVVSKVPVESCFHYLIRKTSDQFRNLCLYADYKMFETIWDDLQVPFKINWGCSGGSVLAYKKKFPVYAEETKYFIKFKRNI